MVLKKGLGNGSKSKQAFYSKQITFLQTEAELYAYGMNFRKSGYTVSTEMLQLVASNTAQKFKTPVIEFKATYEWVQWFLNHWQFLICRLTTTGQKLPENFTELINFQKFVILLRTWLPSFSNWKHRSDSNMV
jgi:hypothetical protein